MLIYYLSFGILMLDIYVDLDFIYYGCDACRNTFWTIIIVVLIPLGIE